jgi:hypothetical protein
MPLKLSFEIEIVRAVELRRAASNPLVRSLAEGLWRKANDTPARSALVSAKRRLTEALAVVLLPIRKLQPLQIKQVA